MPVSADAVKPLLLFGCPIELDCLTEDTSAAAAQLQARQTIKKSSLSPESLRNCRVR